MPDLSMWTPVRVRAQDVPARIDWTLVDGPFTEPFFEQTADRAMRHPFNLAFGRTTGLGALDDALPAARLTPAGFVFHMSRCGSTLVAQMLARLPAALVLSEAQPLDALLRLRRRLGDAHEERLAGWLRGLIAAFVRPHGGVRHVVVKLHAWHVLELPFIARAFPGVPWAFVFREPRAVLRSQAREPGAEVIAGTIDPAYLGMSSETARLMGGGEYMTRLVAALCAAALRGPGAARATFVDHASLPDAVFSALLPAFGIEHDADDEARMRAVAAADSKRPAQPFEPRADGAVREIDDLAARWLDAPYAALRAAARTPG